MTLSTPCFLTFSVHGGDFRRGLIGPTSFRGTAGDHKVPPGHSTPPSPLWEDFFTRKDVRLIPGECRDQTVTREQVLVMGL